jgi:hypothetical protein
MTGTREFLTEAIGAEEALRVRQARLGQRTNSLTSPLGPLRSNLDPGHDAAQSRSTLAPSMRRSIRASGRFSRHEMVGCEYRSRPHGRHSSAILNCEPSFMCEQLT